MKTSTPPTLLLLTRKPELVRLVRSTALSLPCFVAPYPGSLDELREADGQVWFDLVVLDEDRLGPGQPRASALRLRGRPLILLASGEARARRLGVTSGWRVAQPEAVELHEALSQALAALPAPDEAPTRNG